MNRKNANIAILLVIITIAIIVVLQFFGLPGFPTSPAPAPQGNAILDEINETGTVADLRIQTITEGAGIVAAVGDLVTVRYTGLLPDGTVFDSTDAHGGDPLPFVLGEGRVIQGWERGILGMKVGERRILAIPPSLGYGASGNGPIPPNSTLIFDVELVSITSKGAQ